MFPRITPTVCCVPVLMVLLLIGKAPANATTLLYDDFGQPDVSGFEPQILPMVPGWTEEGPIETQQGFTGTLNTGIFHNLEPEFDGHYSNITANQAMFMGARDASQPNIDEPISVHQILSNTYLPGKTYTLSFAVGQSYTFPPNVEAELEMRLFYLDAGSRITVGNVIITPSDLTDVNVPPDGDPPFFNSFTTFGFDVDVLASDPWAGQPIGVEIRPISGFGGFWDVDHVHLTEIPEPASLLALSIGGMLLLGKRR